MTRRCGTRSPPSATCARPLSPKRAQARSRISSATTAPLQQEDNLSLGNLMNQSIAQQLEALDYIYSEYGFDSVFATQEDIITQSQLLQARQRALLVDYIRSNPKISGYSMTQGADIGYRGEGVLEGT